MEIPVDIKFTFKSIKYAISEFNLNPRNDNGKLLTRINYYYI